MKAGSSISSLKAARYSPSDWGVKIAGRRSSSASASIMPAPSWAASSSPSASVTISASSEAPCACCFWPAFALCFFFSLDMALLLSCAAARQTPPDLLQSSIAYEYDEVRLPERGMAGRRSQRQEIATDSTLVREAANVSTETQRNGGPQWKSKRWH